MRNKFHKVIDYLADDLSRNASEQKARGPNLGLILLTIGVIGSVIRSLLSGDVGSLIIYILIGAAVLLFILSKLLVRERRTVAILLYVPSLLFAFISAFLVLFSFT